MLGIPMSVFYVIVFLLGLIIGSFINCLIYRLHQRKSLLGRSFCPKCKHQLAWHDNIPILSYLFLGGKCRYCQKKISIQYPIIEAVTGILFFIVLFAQIGNANVFMFSCFNALIIFRNLVFTGTLIIIFIYDLKYYLILDKITIPAMTMALVFNISISFIQHPVSQLNILISSFWLLIAGLIAAGFFLVQFLISRGQWIGGGDIRLGLLIGLMLGWPNVLAALFLAYIIGSIIGIGLILTHKKNMESQVPFGTFLTVGTFVTLLWGELIIQKYLNLF